MNRHVTRRLVIQHTLACIRSHASAAVAGDGEDEEFTRDAFEDMEVVAKDVVDDGAEDEEEVTYVLLTISEVEEDRRGNGNVDQS
jgi:hypothetical protein